MKTLRYRMFGIVGVYCPKRQSAHIQTGMGQEEKRMVLRPLDEH
ncbi:MAG: hypothetical protein NZM15_07390 [Flavobacteriales bacterium]|nr:hypothetical protein [Flavobacteriales bacterium]MDW8432509.1 hypothetical protein [Flavobacteriales bacterium]